jgi:cell wall-associated NlpC family hydrolase
MSLPYGVVSLAALDLRVRPDHRAEMASQLLLGETVRLGTRRGGWRRVTNQPDGYSGWVREWGLVQASSRRAAAWRRKANAVLRVPVALLRATPAGGIGVGPMFLGSRAIPGRVSKGWVQLELPDSRRGWVERSTLALPSDAAPSIVDRLTSLLGTPYLWGGRTPAGFDCSAFVQQVLFEQGISMPRDAADQRRACRPLRAGEEPRPGDLAFFALRSGKIGHVGMSLGAGLFVHARGRVCLASLDTSNMLYDKELKPQFVGWSRPGSRPLSGSRSPRTRPQ